MGWSGMLAVAIAALGSLDAMFEKPRDPATTSDSDIRIGNLMPYTGLAVRLRRPWRHCVAGNVISKVEPWSFDPASRKSPP